MGSCFSSNTKDDIYKLSVDGIQIQRRLGKLEDIDYKVDVLKGSLEKTNQRINSFTISYNKTVEVVNELHTDVDELRRKSDRATNEIFHLKEKIVDLKLFLKKMDDNQNSLKENSTVAKEAEATEETESVEETEIVIT